MRPSIVVRRLLLALLGITSLSLLFGAYPTSAAPRQRCFSETGLCVSGPILTYWERNGGLAVFGYPITSLTTETVEQWSGPVQWFERDRLEDHGRSGVLAGRLGARALELQGRPWETLPRASSPPQGCRLFPQTGHSLCGVFLNYWQGHGGLQRFGYPVSEPMQGFRRRKLSSANSSERGASSTGTVNRRKPLRSAPVPNWVPCGRAFQTRRKPPSWRPVAGLRKGRACLA